MRTFCGCGCVDREGYCVVVPNSPLAVVAVLTVVDILFVVVVYCLIVVYVLVYVCKVVVMKRYSSEII